MKTLTHQEQKIEYYFNQYIHNINWSQEVKKEHLKDLRESMSHQLEFIVNYIQENDLINSLKNPTPPEN